MRLPRMRLTAVLLAGLAAAGTTVVTLGEGTRPVALELTDGGAWLTDTTSGFLVHVNGPSGRADGVVPLAGAAGHGLYVLDLGEAVDAGGGGGGGNGHVLVGDREMGTLYQVDAEKLGLARSARLGEPGSVAVAAGADIYAVDSAPGSGAVRRYDPQTLRPAGPAIPMADLTGVVGAGDGTLWVTRRAARAGGTGAGGASIVAVRAGQAATPVGVGGPGSRVVPVLAGGEPVAVDLTEGNVVRVGGDGAATPVRLPLRGELLLPPTVPGSSLPLFEPASGRLVVVDLSDGETEADVVLPPGPGTWGTEPGTPPAFDTFGNPLAHGGRVYVPRNARGDVAVLDIASSTFGEPVPVTPDGAAGRIDAFVRDGLLWLDDVTGSGAVVIDGGVSRHVDKRVDDLAGRATTPALPLPPPRTPVPAASSAPPAPATQEARPPALPSYAEPEPSHPAGGEPPARLTQPPPGRPLQPVPGTTQPVPQPPPPPPSSPPPSEPPPGEPLEEPPPPTTPQPQPILQTAQVSNSPQ